jgi:hypothetical protein
MVPTVELGIDYRRFGDVIKESFCRELVQPAFENRFTVSGPHAQYCIH